MFSLILYGVYIFSFPLKCNLSLQWPVSINNLKCHFLLSFLCVSWYLFEMININKFCRKKKIYCISLLISAERCIEFTFECHDLNVKLDIIENVKITSKYKLHRKYFSLNEENICEFILQRHRESMRFSHTPKAWFTVSNKFSWSCGYSNQSRQWTKTELTFDGR